jgi:HK97 family phage prohead protease
LPDDSKTVWGYAVLWDVATVIGRDFREQFARGSLDRTIQEDDIRMLLNHDPGRVIGRTSAGSLRLRVDGLGLRYEVEVNQSTPDGQTLAGTVGRRDVTGVSPGMVVTAENWEDTGNGLPLRIITEARLLELSVVSWPAYEKTTAVLRADNNTAASRRRCEAKMRARGLL